MAFYTELPHLYQSHDRNGKVHLISLNVHRLRLLVLDYIMKVHVTYLNILLSIIGYVSNRGAVQGNTVGVVTLLEGGVDINSPFMVSAS